MLVTENHVQLTDESVFPDDVVLKGVLGAGYAAFCDLIRLYDNNGMTHEWRYYRDGKAWLCKVQKKKKTIVWMSAWEGYINATIYFAEKYAEEVFKLDIDEEWKTKFRTAKKVGKSLACTFAIRESGMLKDFEKVMQYKIGIK